VVLTNHDASAFSHGRPVGPEQVPAPAAPLSSPRFQARLIIDATKAVADKSAYTVLVVQQLDLYDGPNRILNTDYRASDVPIPEGFGPYGGKILLTN
jgi:hypothetical protein